MPGKMKVLAGNSNRPLAEAIAAYLGEPLTRCHVRRFADLEIFVEILENVRGRDAFIIQSTSYPTNDNLMELLIMIDALRRASAQRITAVIPYFGYARQDRKPGPRSPISAKLVANLITRAGAANRLSVGMSKNPWIWPACRSTVSTRSAPARVMRVATSLAEIGERDADFRSCRA